MSRAVPFVKAVTGAAFAALLIPTASANPLTDNQLAHALCKKIQSDTERLKCYDSTGTALSLPGRKLTEDPAFRGIKLGITLDDFRKTPFPDSAKTPKARIICTGDKELKGSSASNIPRSHEQARIGVIGCRYFEPNANWNWPWQEAFIMFGDAASPFVTFYFSPSNFDEPYRLRLYEIALAPLALVHDRLVAALTAKYGEPSDFKTIQSSNRFGAAFTNELRVWDGPSASINVLKFANTTEYSSVLFEHTPTMAAVNKAISNLAKEDASKL